MTKPLKNWKEACRAMVRCFIRFVSVKGPDADQRVKPRWGCDANELRVSREIIEDVPRRRSAIDGRGFRDIAAGVGKTREGFENRHEKPRPQKRSDADQSNARWVTEEEVKAYRYMPTAHFDGKREKGQPRTWMWAGAARENPRVVLKSHSQDGATYIVDGVPLKDGSPADIAKALNTQKPKVLSVLDAFGEVATKE